MLQDIQRIYIEVANEIKSSFNEQINVTLEKHLALHNSFSVVCELIVINRINEDDYGIVFSTNAQTKSHYNEMKTLAGSLFLVSDISFGDGQIIASTEELIYDNSIQEQAVNIVNLIRSFVENNKDKIFYELTTHYGLSVSRS